MSGQYVAFEASPRAEYSRNLTDGQWLGLMAVVDEREGWAWALPRRPGEPARVLPPEGGMTYRVDADGSRYREPFTPAA